MELGNMEAIKELAWREAAFSWANLLRTDDPGNWTLGAPQCIAALWRRNCRTRPYQVCRLQAHSVRELCRAPVHLLRGCDPSAPCRRCRSCFGRGPSWPVEDRSGRADALPGYESPANPLHAMPQAIFG